MNEVMFAGNKQLLLASAEWTQRFYTHFYFVVVDGQSNKLSDILKL